MKRDDAGSGVLVAARISEAERTRLRQVAQSNDRSPSKEIGRAIRYYLENLDAVDEALRPKGAQR